MRIDVAELPQQLTTALDNVRRGEEIELVDGEVAVGRIVPAAQAGLIFSHRADPSQRLGDWRPAFTMNLDVDPVDILLDDRAEEDRRFKQLLAELESDRRR